MGCTIPLCSKKDRRPILFVDYQKLNTMKTNDYYHFPRIDEYINSLGEANIFTTMVASNGYWQASIAPQDVKKTSFVFHVGTYQYI